VAVSAGWALVASETSSADDGWHTLPQSCHRMRIAVDAEALPGSPVLRPPQPGERLQPMGMQGSVKISDLFVNEQIPRPARRRWPVLFAGPTPIWVLGLRVAACASLQSGTRRALIFQLVPPE
jgi:tRNA(Ile)-lysidine synthase